MPSFRAYSDYIGSGYPWLQNLVANIILKRSSGVQEASIATMLLPEPSLTMDLDLFGLFIGAVLPFILVVIYIAPLYNQVYLIVTEKESRTRESMRMMGMTDFPYWLSWFVHYTIVNSILTLIAWAILCINVMNYSHKGLILLFFWLYGQSIFGLIIFF